MDKKLPLICSLAALAVAATALAAVLTIPRSAAQADNTPSPAPAAESAPQGAPESALPAAATPQDAYRLEKLNAVSDMVLDRQVVPEDYLRYLDEALSEKVKAYNSALVNAKAVTVQYAKTWADSFRDLSPEDDWYDEAFADYGKYLKEGDNYFRFIEEFSTALLYPNANDFTFFAPVVGYPAASEAGGSGGLWATGYYLDKSWTDELTSAADELLDQFDAERAAAEE